MSPEAMTILHRGVMDTIRDTMRQMGGTPDDHMTLMEAMAAEAIVNLASPGSEWQVTRAFSANVRELVTASLQQKKATAH